MARKRRAAAKAATRSMRNAPPPPPSPPLPDPSDDEMAEAPPSRDPVDPADGDEEEDNTNNINDNNDNNNNNDGEDDAENEDNENINDNNDNNADHASDKDPETEPQLESASAHGEEEEVVEEEEDVDADVDATLNTPSRENMSPRRRGRISAIPRKRRIGRPPKNPPPDWDAQDTDTPGTPNHIGTPAKRRRGRPGFGGGRWNRHRGPSHVTQVPLDKDGNVLDVVNDEVVLPTDPEGETKVDENGILQGDRAYRVRTFTIKNRGDKLYMLSTEPARCIGFRDSYLFFQKHKMLYKIIIDDEAKRDLISRGLIPHSYKGRAIGVVTARSVFREFGAKIVVGGRKITDDYNVKEARDRGDVEGEIAVPEDRIPGPGEEYNRNQFVAWHGASSVYHTNAPSIPLPIGGKVIDPKKRRVQVTGDNWMIEHARDASTFNSIISSIRRENFKGVYDIHTNAIQYPKVMQPSHARWERLPPPDPRTTAKLMKGMSTLRLTNEQQQEEEEKEKLEKTSTMNGSKNLTTTTAANSTDHDDNNNEENPPQTIFSTIPSTLSRRFAIHDTYFESPRYSNLGIPGPDGDVHDIGTNGLISAANPMYPEFMGPDVLAELPDDCKEALVDTAAREWEWKNRWQRECVHGSRSGALKSYAWFP